MKGMILYLAVMAGGGVAGAVGVGAYNVLVVGVEADAEPAGEEVATTQVEAGAEAAPAQTDVPDEVEQVADADEMDQEGEGADEGEMAVGEEADAIQAEAGEVSGSIAGDTEAGDLEPVSVPIDPEEIARVQANYQRLARIFMAMKPEEAAPVLAQLDDTQLEGILLAMQGRNAAPILAEMDPARVASISRKVLGGNE